jgi:menaquinone-9 beta-reductase
VVARRLGWLRPAWPRRMGVTSSFYGMEAEPGVIEMHMLPGAYCGVVHQADGIAHVGLAFDHAGGDFLNGESLEVFLSESLGRFPGIRERLAGVVLAGPAKAFGPMAVRSRQCAGDGALLVGDAAGFLDPVTGHGIGFAMRSAELAAETIIDAAKAGVFSLDTLSAYPRAYRREFGTQLRRYSILQKVLALPAPALHPFAWLLGACPVILERLIPLLVAGAYNKGTAQPERQALLNREPNRLLRDP